MNQTISDFMLYREREKPNNLGKELSSCCNVSVDVRPDADGADATYDGEDSRMVSRGKATLLLRTF